MGILSWFQSDSNTPPSAVIKSASYDDNNERLNVVITVDGKDIKSCVTAPISKYKDKVLEALKQNVSEYRTSLESPAQPAVISPVLDIVGIDLDEQK